MKQPTDAEIDLKIRTLNRAVAIAADVLEADSRRMSIACRTQADMPEKTWFELSDTARALIVAANYLRNRQAMIADGEKQVMDKMPLPVMPGDSGGIITP